MTDAQDAEQEPSPTPYMRLPVPRVALGIVVFLGLLLGAGLYANANLRAQGVVLPTPVSTAVPPTVEVTVVPVAASTSVTTLQPTVSPVVSPTPDLRPSPTAASTAGLTQVPTQLVLFLDATATASPAISAAQPSPTPTPPPSVEPTLAAEVSRAYENFWRVKSQALLDLDQSHLADVMDGDYLSTVNQRIDDLRSEDRAIKTHVILNYRVVEATQRAASVIDDFEDDSIYVKTGTEEPLSEPVADQLTVLYKLENFSGTWKVVDSVRPD
jgi:hypothetical protein